MKKDKKVYSDKGRSVFKPSRITIRIKLLGIVSAIVAVSMTVMILLATYIFKKHSETRIQEYNLSLSRIIGRKVESDLKNLRYSARTLAQIMQNKSVRAAELDAFSRSFFQENSGFFYLGVARKKKDGLEFTREIFNRKFFKENQLKTGIMEDINLKLAPALGSVIGGENLVANVSPLLGLPAVGLGLPLQVGADEIIVVYRISAGFMGSFESSGQSEIFQMMLVNSQGELIAHSKEEQALKGGNLTGLSIVKSMLKSPGDNGSRRYDAGGIEFLGAYQLLDFSGLGVIVTVESERVFEAVYRIQRRNIIIMIMVLTLAFLLVFFYSGTLAVPIVKLVSAARQVENGEYLLEIKPSTRDEVGILTNAFIHMARGLAERERIKTTFGKFVNVKIAEQAMDNDRKLGGGENKTCTILFTDLRNFTELSENRRPEEVLELLNDYFTGMVDCVHKTGGIVDKFIGDALMAHWGALEAGPNDTEDAVNAALLMREALKNLNRSMEWSGQDMLQFGCGINTGPVIAGQIGSEKRMEYTVIGDAVNLASRIEYLNKLFGTDILISEYSRNQVKGIFRLGRLPPVRIKGKSNPETIYVVLGRKDDPECPRDLQELREKAGIYWDQRAAQAKQKSATDEVMDKELSHGDSV